MPRAKPQKISYSDSFQKNYRYTLTEPVGKNFHPLFRPTLTPAQMLKLGVFGGAYFIGVKNLIPKDIPAAWFKGIKISPDHEKHGDLNFFGIEASQPLSVWQKKGWIYQDDPHGWFQWYCRYYMGRRIPAEDERQIRRWRAIARHIAQLKKACRGDRACRPRQRQAILHWAYDSRAF
jgi:hypothetical protein